MVFLKSLTLLLLVVGSAHSTLRGGSYEGGQELERVSRKLGKDKDVEAPGAVTAPGSVPAPAPGGDNKQGGGGGDNKQGGGGGGQTDAVAAPGAAPAPAPAPGGDNKQGGGGGDNKQGGGGGNNKQGGQTTAAVVVLSCTGTDAIVSTDATTGRVSTLSKCGLEEQMPCLDPNRVVQTAIENQQTSLECVSKTCVGCCRYFNYLFCDTQNLFPHLPCLCNQYTYGGNPFATSGSSATATTTTATTTTSSAAMTGTSGTRDATVPAAPPVVAPASSAADYGCTPGWHEKGLGQKPLTMADDFPSFLAPGECLNSGHCAGTEGGCCLRNFCLCGAGADCL